MSRRFSNLQYISIGILFGTCVFLWTRKLNLTNSFPSSAAGNLRQVARNGNERRLIESMENRLEDDLPANVEDDEQIVYNQDENSNDLVLRPKEAADLVDTEEMPMKSPSASKEVEDEVVDPSKTSPNETVDETQSPEPELPVETVSETVETQTENTVDSEDGSTDSPATSNEISKSSVDVISTTTNSVTNNSPRE